MQDRERRKAIGGDAFMNCTRKGTAAETERVRYWESKGYLTVRTIRTRFRTFEIFGQFDILAFNGKELVLEQVKSGKAKPGRALREALRAWKAEKLKGCELPVRTLISFREDRKGWMVEEVE